MNRIFVSIAVVMFLFAFSNVSTAQSLEENQLYYNFLSNVRSVKNSVEGGDKILPMEFVYCVQAYDKLIASGVRPSTRFPADNSANITGTLEEAKEKWCVAPAKKVDEDWDAKQAPYKAALKSDKLRLVINENSRVIYSYALAGGKYTEDAKALAAAKVWFLDIGRSTAETRICVNGGKLSSVRRYTFDVNHKLVSTTEKEYCGTPPASAYR